jgi:F-type H+-transporting ATPase subunit a
MEMRLAYAAAPSGEHGGEPNVGDVILHHVVDTKLLSLKIFGLALSITKHVVMMWIAAALLIVIFRSAFRQPRAIPTGIANLLEAMIVFIRDEVVVPTMGEEGKPYVPYLLTVFFFILVCNLLGLVPFAATATGNVSVTAGLALMAFMMIQAGGIRKYGLKHHLQNLVPPGIPAWLLPIMIPVEIMGQLTKPFALCIRLFANMIYLPI